MSRRFLLGTVVGLVSLGGTSALAQAPANLETIELTRSRECVSILARLDQLDAGLTPLAERSSRLLAIAEAIALEDDSVVDSLDAADPVQAAVRDWFRRDAELAARYVSQPTPELLQERTASRDEIRVTVTEALEAVQAEADAAIEATGDLPQQASRCNGAVLVRPAVLEGCGTTRSSVCDAARDTAAVRGRYRFVESAADLWDLQELRAWTAPAPLSVGPAGQLGGGRTMGFTRLGNVVVNVAFTPWLQERSELPPEAIERLTALTDTLGFGSSHPEFFFVPALAIRVTLPQALDTESAYLFHFGPPESADVFWSAPANSGQPVEAIVPLTPHHITRLRAGEPMMLTAVREADDGEIDAVYAIELTSLNQATTTSTLYQYMSGQLAADLARLIPPEAP